MERGICGAGRWSTDRSGVLLEERALAVVQLTPYGRTLLENQAYQVLDLQGKIKYANIGATRGPPGIILETRGRIFVILCSTPQLARFVSYCPIGQSQMSRMTKLKSSNPDSNLIPGQSKVQGADWEV